MTPVITDIHGVKDNVALPHSLYTHLIHSDGSKLPSIQWNSIPYRYRLSQTTGKGHRRNGHNTSSWEKRKIRFTLVNLINSVDIKPPLPSLSSLPLTAQQDPKRNLETTIRNTGMQSPTHMFSDYSVLRYGSRARTTSVGVSYVCV